MSGLWLERGFVAPERSSSAYRWFGMEERNNETNNAFYERLENASVLITMLK